MIFSLLRGYIKIDIPGRILYTKKIPKNFSKSIKKSQLRATIYMNPKNTEAHLMTRYYNYLYGYIASRISSLPDTEDILQETYLAAVLSRAALSDETKLKAWLRGIADNKIKQYYRRQVIYRARHTGDEADEDLPVPDTAADAMTARDTLVRLQEEVSLLPENLRGSAIVSLMCGLSGNDAAEILGIPVTTVYNRVHKVKQILREKLEDIMEISLETFSALLDDGKSQTERTCEYLRTFYDLNDQQKYDDMVALLMTAPVFAADCPMAHFIIMQHCTMAMRIIRGPSRDTFKPALKRLGESEFKLAEKLGLRGILDDDTGEEIPEYQFYGDMADFYSAMGDYDAAFAMCERERELGCPSQMRYAMVLQDTGRYEEAITVFKKEAERAGEHDTDRYMAYNRISNCLRALGDVPGQLEYQLKNYEAVKNGAVYSEPEAHAHFLGGEVYYLAMTYANLDEFDNMMKYLTEAVSINKSYRDWARAQDAFAKYRDNEAFVKLCGEGEGKLYSIRIH